MYHYKDINPNQTKTKMDALIAAIGHYTCTDKELTVLVSKVLARLADDIEESGMQYSSVMEQNLEELEEFLEENYVLTNEDEADDDEDEDEDDLRDVDLDEEV